MHLVKKRRQTSCGCRFLIIIVCWLQLLWQMLRWLLSQCTRINGNKYNYNESSKMSHGGCAGSLLDENLSNPTTCLHFHPTSGKEDHIFLQLWLWIRYRSLVWPLDRGVGVRHTHYRQRYAKTWVPSRGRRCWLCQVCENWGRSMETNDEMLIKIQQIVIS